MMESVFTPPYGVRVWLASGDSFYIDGSLDQVKALLDSDGLVEVGTRYVNPRLVCQLTWEAVPSLETPEPIGEAV
jgi:hypothetical protein